MSLKLESVVLFLKKKKSREARARQSQKPDQIEEPSPKPE